LLFADCSLEQGKTVSKAERHEKGLTGQKSLIYGEVEFRSFAKVLRKISPPEGAVFVDLGSGTGKAVFVARLLHDFGKCGGVEVLEGLHAQALKVKQRYGQLKLNEYLTVGGASELSLVQGSILDDEGPSAGPSAGACSWHDADVVFANSTCFDDALMAQMALKARKLKPGAFFVTFTKGLASPQHFEVLERKRYKMSWGPATVYIQRRLNADGTSVAGPGLKDVPDDDEYDSPADDSGDDSESSEEEEEDSDQALEDLD